MEKITACYLCQIPAPQTRCQYRFPSDGDGDNTDTSGLSALAFDGSTNSLIQTRRASDASFSVNGLDLSSATNKVSNVIDGVDLELLAVTSDASFEVVYDDSTMVKNVESFVAAYNDVASTIKSLTHTTPKQVSPEACRVRVYLEL